jgi:hypothetical protein
MAAAAASLFISVSKASMSATSMDSATRLGSLGWTNVVMFLATPAKTSSRFGDASQWAQTLVVYLEG